MKQKSRILIMAGGTGGHVFPGLAVAKSLISQGCHVAWLGTKAGLESQILKNTDIPLYFITAAGLRRQNIFKRMIGSLQLLLALCQSLWILSRYKPCVVLGMGGFVAGPGGLAAWLLRYPLVIHEQNAIPGVTNRILSKLATRVLEGFENSFPKEVHAICTGNPVREDLLNIPDPKERFASRKGPMRILILGGSRGAQVLNERCPLSMQIVAQTVPKENLPEIWHQTGKQGDTASLYQRQGIKAKVEPFIEDMVLAYTWADIVICRAGASTVSELAAIGLGAILVPFPFAVDDHQTHNGRFLERVGGARIIQQKDFLPEKLAGFIIELSAAPGNLLKMAAAAKTLARPKALSLVANNCIEVCGDNKK